MINDRARDVVDLLLLRELAATTGAPALADIRAAAVAVFEARAAEARALGRPPREWPPSVVAPDHWVDDYIRSAMSADVDLTLAEAIIDLNLWIAEIDAAL
jgi:hypothetical protein